MAKKLDVQTHVLVPNHTILSDTDADKVLDSLNITKHQLPKILKTDPALAELKAKVGDLVKIERSSQTAGQSVYYRVVTEE